MTEQTHAPGATAVAEPPAPFLPETGEELSDGANRRKLMMVGAVAGVVVLALAAFFLLKGGGSSSPASSAPVASFGHSGGAPAAPVAAKPLRLPKVYKGHVGRDPFKPLYVAPAPKPSTAPSAPAAAPAPTGTSTTPTTTTTVGHPVWVELVSVTGTKSATFRVGYSNGSKLTVRWYRDVLAPTGSTPTVFAKQFSLLSIQNGEATVQFGDGTPVDIAPGAANRLTVS